MSDEKTIIADSFNATIFSPSSRPAACLVQYSGANLGRRYVLESADMIAGRADEATIQIKDASVSRQHARFHVRGTDVEVEDLKTTNGTFVNETRIDRGLALKDGDMVRLGTVLFKFFAHGNIENVFHDKIYRMATIDATTQIFNKKYLMEALEAEIKVTKNYKRNMTLIMYDLDFFKKVNDVYGHNAGDLVLRDSAHIVRGVVRKNDIFGRFGGEEFAIILPETDAKTGVDLAERIRRAVEGHGFKLGSKMHRQTISIGVAQFSSEMKTPQALIESADKKLYHSKNSGRNKVSV